MNEFAIRSAVPHDAPQIAAHNVAMALETEHVHLDPVRTRAGVDAVFSDPSRGFYLVADAGDGRVVGQLMITFEWSDWRNGNFWWIQSVFVHPDWRGRGIYRNLHQEVRQRAQASGNVCGIRLYVERDNHKAQQAYEHQGMIATTYRIYETDFVIKRESGAASADAPNK